MDCIHILWFGNASAASYTFGTVAKLGSVLAHKPFATPTMISKDAFGVQVSIYRAVDRLNTFLCRGTTIGWTGAGGNAITPCGAFAEDAFIVGDFTSIAFATSTVIAKDAIGIFIAVEFAVDGFQILAGAAATMGF